MAFTPVPLREELWEGEMRAVEVAGQPVLLVKVGGAIVAFENRCAHQRVALSEGQLQGTTLTCSAHGWSYDVTDGHGLNPADARLCRLPVRVDGERLLVDVSPCPALRVPR
jgi:toluene monooxygenase system ferredoxin subunit